MKSIREYDLHPAGARVDEALARLERIISGERSRHGLIAVITGYGSTGGTARIKRSVLAACETYRRQNHIRGYLDGEKAGDPLSPEALAFPGFAGIPVSYRRSANPGVVIIAT